MVAMAEYGVLSRCGETVVGAGAAMRGLSGFALGMLLYRFFGAATQKSALFSNVAEAVSLCLITAAFATRSPVLFPFAAALLIVALSWGKGLLSSVLSAPALHRIGEISFSIYLLHVPVMIATRSLFKAVAAHAGWTVNDPRYGYLSGLALVCIIILLSEFTFRFVEEPGRSFGKTIVLKSKVRQVSGLVLEETDLSTAHKGHQQEKTQLA